MAAATNCSSPSGTGWCWATRGRDSSGDKAAYDPSVETTIYCAADATGKGIGSLMYEALFKALEGADVHRALAGITMPNDASVALHRRFGFEQVALFSEVGRKFDRYWDVMWMEKRMK